MRLKFSNVVLGLSSGLVYAFLYAPIVVLIIFSFNKERINSIWTGFTLIWYSKVLHNVNLLGATKVSFIVAISATLISTVIGTLTAFGMSRYNFPGKRLLDATLLLPIIIPDVVMAIAMLLFYVLIHMTLGIVSIVIAHVTFNISFVTVVVRARLSGLDHDLEKAALDLGATPFKVFRYVILPIISPGIIAGALLAFTLSWDDFMIAFFTAGPGSTTLPLKVYSMVRFGVSPEINAISVMSLLISMCLIFFVVRLEGASIIKNLGG